MTSVATIQGLFAPSEDSLGSEDGNSRSQSGIQDFESRGDIAEVKVPSNEPNPGADPAMEAGYSAYSQGSIEQSTAATQGSSPLLSTVLSGIDLEIPVEDFRFLGSRIKQLMETNSPEQLIRSGVTQDMLKTVTQADRLLKLLDNALLQLLEIQRDFFQIDPSKFGIELMDRWIWIILQALSKLNFSKRDRNRIQEHFTRKLCKISELLTQASRYLIHMSVNTRIADKLLKDVIAGHRDKFQLSWDEASIATRTLKPKRSRFVNNPKLFLVSSPPSEPEVTPFKVVWTEADGLIIKGRGDLTHVEFTNFSRKEKLALINKFFDTIVDEIIKPGTRRLEEMTTILARIRSTSKHFGQPTSLSLKYTNNGLENHIIRVNFYLEKSKTESWNKTFGFAFIRYVEDIRIRMGRVITTAEVFSQKLDRIQSEFERVEHRIGKVLVGNLEELPEPKVGRMLVKFSGSGLPGSVMSTFKISNTEGESSVSSVWTDDDDGSLPDRGDRAEKPDVKISILDIGSPSVSRWKRFKKLFTWKKT